MDHFYWLATKDGQHVKNEKCLLSYVITVCVCFQYGKSFKVTVLIYIWQRFPGTDATKPEPPLTFTQAACCMMLHAFLAAKPVACPSKMPQASVLSLISLQKIPRLQGGGE